MSFFAAIGVVWYVNASRKAAKLEAQSSSRSGSERAESAAFATFDQLRGNGGQPAATDPTNPADAPAATTATDGVIEGASEEASDQASDQASESGASDQAAESAETPASDAEPAVPAGPDAPPAQQNSPTPRKSQSSGPIPKPPADRLANMTLVPAGPFLYGESNRQIELPAYYIDLYEVSQEEYAQFMTYIARTGDHSRCHPDELPNEDHTPLYWGEAYLSDPRYPVIGLDFWDVNAYAGWVGKRLPTEEEWEKAARGPDGQAFPWGGAWKPELCNWGPSEGNDRTLMPVDSLPEGRSPYGCHHMLGNAAEWTSSMMENTRGLHIGRGYCWRLGAMTPFKVTMRMPGRTELRDEGSGLRCALDPPAAAPAAAAPDSGSPPSDK